LEVTLQDCFLEWYEAGNILKLTMWSRRSSKRVFVACVSTAIALLQGIIC